MHTEAQIFIHLHEPNSCYVSFGLGSLYEMGEAGNEGQGQPWAASVCSFAVKKIYGCENQKNVTEFSMCHRMYFETTMRT